MVKNQKKIIISSILVIVCLCGAIYFGLNNFNNKEITFPYIFEDNKLEITNLITFDGPNIDNNNQEGENIAALQLKNISNEYLENLTITLKMENKQEYSFVIEELPANETVLALEVNNKQYDMNNMCKSLSYKSKFNKNEIVQPLDVTINGAAMLIKNTTSKTYKNITVNYHCLTDEFYFGGKSYSITIPELLSGQEYSYDDSNCWMGTPKVVRISMKEQ